MISGLLLMRWPWPSIFWFLSVASFAALVSIVLFLPETCRVIVGNGTYSAPKWNLPLFHMLCPSKLQPTASRRNQAPALRVILNPLSGLTLLRHPATLVVSLCYGVYYTVHSCLQASLSTMFVDIYHISGLKAGLIYIPFGVACMIASFVAGM